MVGEDNKQKIYQNEMNHNNEITVEYFHYSF